MANPSIHQKGSAIPQAQHSRDSSARGPGRKHQGPFSKPWTEDIRRYLKISEDIHSFYILLQLVYHHGLSCPLSDMWPWNSFDKYNPPARPPNGTWIDGVHMVWNFDTASINFYQLLFPSFSIPPSKTPQLSELGLINMFNVTPCDVGSRQWSQYVPVIQDLKVVTRW